MKEINRTTAFFTFILLILLLITTPASITLSEEMLQLDEKGKLFSIAQSLEFRKRPYIKEDESFCKSFLGALKAKKEIEFIEPIIRTDDYNDPTLQSYMGKCPNLHLNKSVAFEPRIWEYARTLPEEEREKLGTVWYTTMDFRLYHVDVDNNQKNGKEYLFYGGGGFSPKEKFPATFTDYLLVDFEKCKIKGTRQVRDTVNYLTKKPTGSHNFVIRFRGRSYILDLIYYPNEDRYYVSLYGWRMAKAAKKLLSFLLCTYEQQKQEKGGVQK